ATATPTSPMAPARTLTANSFLIVRSFSLCPCIHGIDDVLVLFADEGPLQFHRRRELLVLRGEDLLDQPERLDGFHPRELFVHPLDLAGDQILDLLGAAER